MTPKQFKRYRLKMQLTQHELGLALGLSRVSVNRIENGAQAITADVAIKVGVALAFYKQKGAR